MAYVKNEHLVVLPALSRRDSLKLMLGGSLSLLAAVAFGNGSALSVAPGALALSGDSAGESGNIGGTEKINQGYSRLQLPGDRILLNYAPGDNIPDPDSTFNVVLVCEENGNPVSGGWAGWYATGSPEAKGQIIGALSLKFPEYKDVNFVSDGPGDGDAPMPLVGIYGTGNAGENDLLWLNPRYSNLGLRVLVGAPIVPYARDQFHDSAIYNANGGCEDVMIRQNITQQR